MSNETIIRLIYLQGLPHDLAFSFKFLDGIHIELIGWILTGFIGLSIGALFWKLRKNAEAFATVIDSSVSEPAAQERVAGNPGEGVLIINDMPGNRRPFAIDGYVIEKKGSESLNIILRKGTRRVLVAGWGVSYHADGGYRGSIFHSDRIGEIEYWSGDRLIRKGVIGLPGIGAREAGTDYILRLGDMSPINSGKPSIEQATERGMVSVKTDVSPNSGIKSFVPSLNIWVDELMIPDGCTKFVLKPIYGSVSIMACRCIRRNFWIEKLFRNFGKNGKIDLLCSAIEAAFKNGDGAAKNKEISALILKAQRIEENVGAKELLTRKDVSDLETAARLRLTFAHIVEPADRDYEFIRVSDLYHRCAESRWRDFVSSNENLPGFDGNNLSGEPIEAFQWACLGMMCLMQGRDLREEQLKRFESRLFQISEWGEHLIKWYESGRRFESGRIYPASVVSSKEILLINYHLGWFYLEMAKIEKGKHAECLSKAVSYWLDEIAKPIWAHRDMHAGAGLFPFARARLMKLKDVCRGSNHVWLKEIDHILVCLDSLLENSAKAHVEVFDLRTA